MASALLLDKGLMAKSHSGIIYLIGSQFVAKIIRACDSLPISSLASKQGLA